MKVLFRALIVWLMLLTVPFQGLAAAGALPCAPAIGVPADAAAQAQAMPAGEHDHAAMLAAMEQVAQGQQDADGSEGQAPAEHGASSSHHCGGVSPCCVGAALAPSLTFVSSGPRLTGKLIPHHAAPPAAVDLASLERPPRHLHA